MGKIAIGERAALDAITPSGKPSNEPDKALWCRHMVGCRMMLPLVNPATCRCNSRRVFIFERDRTASPAQKDQGPQLVDQSVVLGEKSPLI